MLISRGNPYNTNFTAKGVMVGRFDPFTNGHKKMAQIGAQLFDELIIIPSKPVMGAAKTEFLPFDVRVNLIKDSVKDLPNVKVELYDGYTGDYARTHGVDFILRGARNKDEFIFEQELAEFNHSKNNDLTTVIIPDKKGDIPMSATMVRERIKNNESFADLVPEPIKNFIIEHLSELREKLR